jgi:DNA-binding NarL/FixJ family response regulator
MIRLYIIEDHIELVLSSFLYMFRDEKFGISISGTAETPEQAVRQANPETFDVIILDLMLPGLSPVENIRVLREAFPDKPIVIYTAELSSGWCDKMKEEGAMAYVTKDSSRELIWEAIKKAQNREFFFMSGSKETDGSQPSGLGLNALSPTEANILRHLSNGLTHKDIASRMVISRSKIEKVLWRLRKKYSVSNNVELIKELGKRNII